MANEPCHLPGCDGFFYDYGGPFECPGTPQCNGPGVDDLGTAHLAREPTATYHAGPWENDVRIWSRFESSGSLGCRAASNRWAGHPWGCADVPPLEF